MIIQGFQRFFPNSRILRCELNVDIGMLRGKTLLGLKIWKYDNIVTYDPFCIKDKIIVDMLREFDFSDVIASFCVTDVLVYTVTSTREYLFNVETRHILFERSTVDDDNPLRFYEGVPVGVELTPQYFEDILTLPNYVYQCRDQVYMEGKFYKKVKEHKRLTNRHEVKELYLSMIKKGETIAWTQ